MLAKDATPKDISEMKERLLEAKRSLIFNYESQAAIAMVNNHKKSIQEEKKYDSLYQ